MISGLEPRPAAKAILCTTDDRYLLVSGERTIKQGGHYSLPGGGIEGKETRLAALYRELAEELPGFSLADTAFYESGMVAGPVTNRYGEPRIAQWHLFRGLLAGRNLATLDPRTTRLLDRYQIVQRIPELSELAVRAILDLPRIDGYHR